MTSSSRLELWGGANKLCRALQCLACVLKQFVQCAVVLEYNIRSPHLFLDKVVVIELGKRLSVTSR